MKANNLESWEEFLEKLKELEIKYSKGKSSPDFIYRGQGIKKSIFVYFEMPRGIKSIGDNYTRISKPWIYQFPSGTEPDQRHKIQKSRYTVCITLNKMPSAEWRYAHTKWYSLEMIQSKMFYGNSIFLLLKG